MPLEEAIPNLNGISLSLAPATINWIIVIFLFSMAMMVLIKLIQNKISVQVYEYINGGYAVTTSRYRAVFDKKTNMHTLYPMWGKTYLPAYSSEAYQKILAMPMIGSNRILRLIKRNKYTYDVIVPQANQEEMPRRLDYDTKPWIYKEMTREVEKKIAQVDFKYVVSYLAPVIVICMCIAIFSIAIYTDQMLMQQMTASINEITEIFKAVIQS